MGDSHPADAVTVALLIGALVGVTGTVVIGEYGFPDSPNATPANKTTVERGEKVSTLPEKKYGERGVWRFTENGTVCYYAQTYSGSGYSVSIDCVRGESR